MKVGIFFLALVGVLLTGCGTQCPAGAYQNGSTCTYTQSYYGAGVQGQYPTTTGYYPGTTAYPGYGYTGGYTSGYPYGYTGGYTSGYPYGYGYSH